MWSLEPEGGCLVLSQGFVSIDPLHFPYRIEISQLGLLVTFSITESCFPYWYGKKGEHNTLFDEKKLARMCCIINVIIRTFEVVPFM